jgi:hypothetical protein
MVTKTARAVLAAALAMAAAGVGCDKAEQAPSGPAVTSDTDVDEGGILRRWPASPSGGFHDPVRMLVKDGQTWKATWGQANANLAPIPGLPPVDFGREMVAVVSLGEKATGGWSVEVVGVKTVEGKVRILYAEQGPPPAAAAAQVVTHPWHAAVVARTDLPVEWVRYVPATPEPRKK